MRRKAQVTGEKNALLATQPYDRAKTPQVEEGSKHALVARKMHLRRNRRLQDCRPPDALKAQKSEREKYEQLTTTNTLKIAESQDRLYAESHEGVVILIQAMDAAGKDSAIKHVIPAGQMARLASSRDSLCGNEG